MKLYVSILLLSGKLRALNENTDPFLQDLILSEVTVFLSIIIACQKKREGNKFLIFLFKGLDVKLNGIMWWTDNVYLMEQHWRSQLASSTATQSTGLSLTSSTLRGRDSGKKCHVSGLFVPFNLNVVDGFTAFADVFGETALHIKIS